MQILEAVIHLYLWPQWLTLSSICIIFHITLSLIHNKNNNI